MIKVIKGIFYYSGFEYIYRKIKPAQEARPLPTLPLWLIGIYVATFGVASQRYENRVDIIENKANTIYAQLASPDPVTKGMAFRMISDIEKIECPYKPDIKNPISIYFSFFKQSTYEGVANLMKETVENWKGSLKRVDLSGTNLQEMNLEGANLEGASLHGANLIKANLFNANLRGARLTMAKLGGAILQQANLEGASLGVADFDGADLSYANLVSANLEGANLEGANLYATDLEGAQLGFAILKDAQFLTLEQLSKVNTMFLVRDLNPKLMEQVKEKYPQLLEEPKSTM